MAKYLLSKSAESDFKKIANHTIENFGINQARVYKIGLIICFQELTDRPEMGRFYQYGNSTLLLRYRYKSHLVFYKRINNGIFIIRVVGERMDFIRHL
jgi:toxin ParE1/3/4